MDFWKSHGYRRFMSEDMDEEEFVKRLHVAFEREAERYPDERERIFRGEKEELVRLVAQEYQMNLEHGSTEHVASKNSDDPLEAFLEQSREIFGSVDSNEISEEEEISEEASEDFTEEEELSFEEESDEEYKKKKAKKERKKQEAYRKANEERAERQRKEFREQQELRQREEEKLQEADRQRREQQVLYERQMEEQRQLQERQMAEGKAQLEAQQKNYEKQQEELRQKDSFKQEDVRTSTVPSNGAQVSYSDTGSSQGSVPMTGSGEPVSGTEDLPQRDLYREKYSSEALHKQYQEEDRRQAELDKQADLKRQRQEAVTRQIEKEKFYETYQSVNQDGHFHMEEARQGGGGNSQNVAHEGSKPIQSQDPFLPYNSQTIQNSPNHLSQTFPNTNYSSITNPLFPDAPNARQGEAGGVTPPYMQTETGSEQGKHESYFGSSQAGGSSYGNGHQPSDGSSVTPPYRRSADGLSESGGGYHYDSYKRTESQPSNVKPESGEVTPSHMQTGTGLDQGKSESYFSSSQAGGSFHGNGHQPSDGSSVTPPYRRRADGFSESIGEHRHKLPKRPKVLNSQMKPESEEGSSKGAYDSNHQKESHRTSENGWHRGPMEKTHGSKSSHSTTEEFCLLCGKKKSLCTCEKKPGGGNGPEKVCPVCGKKPCVCKSRDNREDKNSNSKSKNDENETSKGHGPRKKSFDATSARERFYDFRENAYRASQGAKRFSRRVGFTKAVDGLTGAFGNYASRALYSGDDTADAIRAKDKVMEKGRVVYHAVALFAPGEKAATVRGLVKLNNADELVRLRKFRDDQIAMNPGGKRQIRRAYRQQEKALNESGTKMFTRTLKSRKELEAFRKELGLEHLTDKQLKLRMERIEGKGLGKLLRKGNLTPEQLEKLANLRSEMVLRKYHMTNGSRLLHARALLSSFGGMFVSSARQCEDAGMQGTLKIWDLSRNRYVRKASGKVFGATSWITKNTIGKALEFTGALAGKAARAAGRAALNTKAGQAGVLAAKAGTHAAKVAGKEAANFAKRKIRTAANTKIGHAVGKGIKTGVKGAETVAKGAGVLGHGVGFVGKQVGKVYGIVAKPFQLVGKAIDAIQALMKKLLFVVAGFLLFSVILAIILNICGSAVSFIFGEETADGKIDLAPFVKILDEANKDFTKRLDKALANNGGKYDNVTVSYIGAENGDNYKEILSMMAVRMGQEFTKEHTKKEVEAGKCDNVGLSWTLKDECKGHMDETEKYLKFIYQKSHTITSVPSDFYQCGTQDCATRKVTVPKKDENGKPMTDKNGKPLTETIEEKYCPGKHQDLVVTVQVLKFDELFGIDYYGGGSSGMAVASQRLVQVALEEVGTTDGSKYWEFAMGSSFVDGDKTPWCAAFVTWCAEQCGYIEDGLFPKSGSTEKYRSFFSSKGLYKTPGEYTPKAGDILIETKDTHAAIVKSVENGQVNVINGNWNDKVAESSYPLDSPKIAGYCTPEYPMGEMIEIPAGMGTAHTYMGWQLCTAVGTPQNNLLQMEGKFDEEGFGRIDGRYVVACTTTFGNVGDYVDFYRADGSVLQTVIGDIKNQNDAGCNEWGHLNGQVVVEFIVDEDTWYNPFHENPGSASCHPEWGSSNPVVSAVKLGINYFGDAGSSKPGNSNGVMKPQASGDWDGWTEDNIEWAKNIYGLEDAEWKETYSGFEGNGSIITGGGDNVITGTGQFSHPCPGMTYQSSYFGEIREFETGGHKGHDYAAPEGTPTYAAADGTVLIAGWSDSAGNWIVIDHGNGLVSKYMHHSAIFVTAGQTVKKGDHIGAVGSTGQSTGPHLHFQVEENGIAVNPDKYLLSSK